MGQQWTRQRQQQSVPSLAPTPFIPPPPPASPASPSLTVVISAAGDSGSTQHLQPVDAKSKQPSSGGSCSRSYESFRPLTATGGGTRGRARVSESDDGGGQPQIQSKNEDDNSHERKTLDEVTSGNSRLASHASIDVPSLVGHCGGVGAPSSGAAADEGLLGDGGTRSATVAGEGALYGASSGEAIEAEGLQALIDVTDVVGVVAAMREHVGVEKAQKVACWTLITLIINDEGNRTRAGTVGAIEAVAVTMHAHAGSTSVQQAACRALTTLTINDEGNRTRAGTAGAIEAVAAAMRAHAWSAGVQEVACAH